jgi:hypothetical protein
MLVHPPSPPLFPAPAPPCPALSCPALLCPALPGPAAPHRPHVPVPRLPHMPWHDMLPRAACMSLHGAPSLRPRRCY